MAEVSIRPMRIEDYNEAYQLWAGTAGMGLRSLDDSAVGIARFLARNPDTSFVAYMGQELVGVILCGYDGRRGYIYHTAVKEKYRRKGTGRVLVDAALGALKKEGINKAALVVFCTNESGNRFWQSIGFETRNDLIYRNISLNDINI